MKHVDGNGRPDYVEAERFHRVLQGQELVHSRIHGVACSHSSDTPDVKAFMEGDSLPMCGTAR